MTLMSTTHDAAPMQVFLQGLRRESGLYADSAGTPDDVRSTLSVIKALGYGGDRPANDDLPVAIMDCLRPDGGFAGNLAQESSVLATVAALIGLANLHAPQLPDVLDSGLQYCSANAQTKFDHFMLIAACEECGRLDAVPQASVAFFTQLLDDARSTGAVVDAGIASSALLRAGAPIRDSASLVELLLRGQDPVTGGFGGPGEVSLFGTYCVMRALAMLGAAPHARALLEYLDSLRTPLGFGATPGGATSAGATYQALGILEWLRALQREPLRRAADGDRPGLQEWVDRGGELNLPDERGWTVLASAASRGQSETVEWLLGAGADPHARIPASDLLAVHLAAQKGDATTVRLLLEAVPEHVHATSSVNGHTVLLQAAFYGKSGHQDVVRLVLDGRDDDSRARLLADTNVRGYNAVGMQDLWHNEPMKALLVSYYPAGLDGEFAAKVTALRDACIHRMLVGIATPSQLSERMMTAISRYVDAGDEKAHAEARELLTLANFEINRLAGPLLMTPLVFACTGVDVGHPRQAKRRQTMVRTLLEAGADPAVLEKHPMAVGAVIRASVLNNFDLLKLIASTMTPQAFAAEMNTSPAINGLTAMHDAVHRALSSPTDELHHHLEQIEWMLEHGARLDIEDNTGQTQDELARAAQSDPAFDPQTVTAVNAVLDRYRQNVNHIPPTEG